MKTRTEWLTAMVAVVMLAGMMSARGGEVLTSVPVGTDARDYTWGYGFLVLTNDIQVTALGFYDNGGDGLAASHAVGLYGIGGNQITNVTVPSGTAASFSNGYRYVTLSTPITLYGGGRYALNAVNLGDVSGDAAAGNFTPHWNVGQFTDSYASGSTLPTTFNPGGLTGAVRYAPNALFDVIPVTWHNRDAGSFVIAPTNVTYSTQYNAERGAIKTINGSGLSDNGTSVTNRAPIPGTWPTHDTDYKTAWHTAVSEPTPVGDEWISFQFDKVYQFEGYHLWNYNYSAMWGCRTWTISNSLDGVTWESGAVQVPTLLQLAPVNASYTGIDVLISAPFQAKYVKLLCAYAGNTSYTGMSEIRFLGFVPPPQGTTIMIR